jgi:hypothetical protein
MRDFKEKKMREKMMHLTPEEREKFKEVWRDKCSAGFSTDTTEPTNNKNFRSSKVKLKSIRLYKKQEVVKFKILKK